MTHIQITDYAYYTSKNMFNSLESALEHKPSTRQRVLNCRAYELETYRVDTKGVSYTVNLESRKDLVISQ